MAPDRTSRDARRAARGGWTVRTRVLSTMLAFMAAGLAVTGVLTYAAQFRALEDRVEAELGQELRELERIAQAADGSPRYDSVDALMQAVTESAAPSDHESVLALVDGEPLYRPVEQDFDLATEEALDRIRAAHVPGGTVTTSAVLDGRDVRLLIASVQVEGDASEGIFVVASDVGVPRGELWTSVATYVVIALLTLVIAGLVGSRVTGRLLRPLGDLRRATTEVTVEDLSRRVPVPPGRDDVAALAQNFNRMLGRIQEGFSEQRRFMSDVGHELRTPLTIVRGTLETTDPEDPDDVRETHGIAGEELDRMGRVVGDLSELAASTRPDFVTPRPVDVAAFAASAFARLSRIEEDRDWVFEGAPERVVEADEQRLTQAVVQLAANAVRYSAPGSRIRVGVDRVHGPDGGEIHLRVADEGIGIDPAEQERVFERFARVDPARVGGSGLGLPIVRAIARGHGGEVRLDSEPGRGSTFTLVIPERRPRPDPGADGEDRPEHPRPQDRRSA